MNQYYRSGGHSTTRPNHAYRGKSRFPANRNRFMPKSLDPRLFVCNAAPEEEKKVTIENTFSDFALHPQLLTNLLNKGFSQPTPIQDKTIKPGLEGRDILGLADTGTGKTIAFSLPILNKLLSEPKSAVLIMAPTRELAVQIRDEVRSLATNLPLYPCLLIGGSDINRQINDLRRQPNIIIGTPGRLKDLYQRRRLFLQNITAVVLDEMDRMLDMGFIHDITEILSYLPAKRQTLLFSATIDERVEKIALQFMVDPFKVSVKTGATCQNVEQNIIRASGKLNKLNTLKDLLSQPGFQKVLVFGRTKYGVEEISLSLLKDGYRAGSIHGDKRQSQRENTLRQFKEGKINVLIATDVAARGIDVKDISHVINFDQPGSYEDYIHRIGRTGRAGKTGVALTFVD